MSDSPTATTPSICLIAIMKNESKILERFFRSAAPYVTDYVLLDTGSTDGSQERAVEIAAELEIPGTVVETQWTNFGEARTLLMQYARELSSSEWALQIDLDWELVLDTNDTSVNPFEFLNNLEEFQAAHLSIADQNLRWGLPQLTRLTHPWEYTGKVHESLTDNGKGGLVAAAVPGITAYHRADGANKTGRQERDLIMLQDETDPRSQFYYAQTLRDLGRHEEAIDNYLERANRIDGWDEEVYWSMLQAGRSYQDTRQIQLAINILLRAWALRPHRVEALCTICEIFIAEKNWMQAQTIAEVAIAQASTGRWRSDSLFIEEYRHTHGAEVLLAHIRQEQEQEQRNAV